MAAMIFDTLKLARAPRTDFTQDQAEALASAIAASAQDSVATKADLSELEVDLVRWIVTAIAFNFLATAGLFIAFSKLFNK